MGYIAVTCQSGMDLETFSKTLGVGWSPEVQGELGGGEGHDEKELD